MTNNNLADISVFESIQLNQHNRTNMGSMSVFNSDAELDRLGASLASMIKEFIDKKDKGVDTASLKTKIDATLKQYNTMGKADGAALRKEVSEWNRSGKGNSEEINARVSSHNAIIKKYKRMIDSI